jgi:hypothetical protein
MNNYNEGGEMRRGGGIKSFMYRVRFKNRDAESGIIAHNLKDLKEQVIAKFGSTDDVTMVEKFDLKYRRYFVVESTRSNKFDEGGEIDIEDLPIEVQDVLQKYQYEEEDYHTMLRMSKELNDLGYTFDFGLDAIPTNFRKMKKGGQVGEIKDAIDILESLGDDIDDNVKQALDMLKIVYDEMELPEQPKSIEDIIGENAYKKGGRMKFRDKVDAIADRLEGTKVPKRLRKDYGVTFNREEAEMSGRRIVGSMVKKYGK